MAPVRTSPLAARAPGGLPVARAQSWEDPALLDALAVQPVDEALVLEPSGDDALALLAAGAGRVTLAAADPAAAALAELKRAAARALPPQSVHSLLGLGHFGRRVWFYHYLRGELPPAARAVLDAHEGAIRAGILGQGRLERAMASFRARVLPLTGLDPARPERAGLRWRAAAGASMPGLARLAGASDEGAAERVTRILRERPGPFTQWLLEGRLHDPDGAPGWFGRSSLGALRGRTDALDVVPDGPAALAQAGRRFACIVTGRPPVDPELLARLLVPGGRVLGWAPPGAPLPDGALRVDGRTSADLALRDRGLFPGRPWLGRRDD